MYKNGNKREIILRAALAVFAREGFHNAKMDDIAREAGVGKGTIYGYFVSKKELFLNTIKYIASRYLQELEALAAEECGSLQKLQQVIWMTFRFAEENREAQKMLLNNRADIIQELHEWFCDFNTELLELLVKIIKEGQHQGQIRKINPYFAAAALQSLFHIYHMFMHCCKTPWEASDKNELSTAIYDIFLNGIKV